MKTTIKLVLVYIACQILGALLAMILTLIYTLIVHGVIDMEGLQQLMLAPAMFLGFVFMTLYLWRSGYISKDKLEWSPVSINYLLLTVAIYAASVLLIDFVLSLLPEMPNLMEQSFEILQSGWFGILCIALFGPIVEELLFRGGITKALLAKYSPAKAIIISALVFGIIHINPAQILSAALIGLLLGWIYYKTASIIPCILVHILNNSLSVYLNVKYPDVESTEQLFGGTSYMLIIAVAVVVFMGAFYLMRQTKVPYPWKKEADTI